VFSYPFPAAINKAVSPLLFCKFISAPVFSNCLTIATFPFLAAIINGVSSALFFKLTSVAFKELVVI
jgi:hypothetical protein